MSSTLPLSFQQEWLWDAIQANPSWQCAPARAFRLQGPLNITLLQQCLQEVTRNHDALRTHIVALDGAVKQEIRDPPESLLERVRVTGTSTAQIVSNARRCVEDLGDRVLNPAVDPLWSARLLELNESEHWLVVVMHRLIGDCVSIDQLYHETRLLYSEWLQGLPSPLKPPAQYGDYTAWQQQACVDWSRRHEPYWKKQLAEAAPVQWPAETSLAPAPPGSLGKVSCSFGKTLSAGLQDLARAARTLAAVPMFAIYAAVLWRWCRQSDFVLPLNTTGRPSAYKSAIGYFSYVLYLRLRITGEETFKELVSRVGNELFSSLAHPDFGRLARQHPELLSGALFQWVTLQPDEAPDERVDVREFAEGQTIVPPGMTAIEVTAFDTTDGLRAFGSYRVDRFAAQTMEQFMEDLRWAAEIFVRNPDARIAAVAEAGGDVHGAGPRAVRGSGAAYAGCGSGGL